MSVLVNFLPTKKLFVETTICSLTKRVAMGGATIILNFIFTAFLWEFFFPTLHISILTVGPTWAGQHLRVGIGRRRRGRRLQL